MNILHLQLSGGPGGIVSLCRDINKHSAHHNFFYFLFEGGSIADEIAAQGGTVQVATGAKNHPLKAATDLVRYCKEQQIDVIVDHSGSPYTRFVHIYTAWRLKKVRFLLYLHANAYYSADKGIKEWGMWMASRIEKRFLWSKNITPTQPCSYYSKFGSKRRRVAFG